MDKSDLLIYAKEYATTQDLYELLGVTADTPKEDIHRAWRKKSIKYHPDKAGEQFDAAKWELFERARDVLCDPAAREVYDGARSAALLREQQRRAMDAKRRAMVEDLEARERGAVKRTRGEGTAPTMSEAERRRLAEAGKRRMEERQRLMKEAEERERRRQREREREREQEQETETANKGTQPKQEPPNPTEEPQPEPGRGQRRAPDDIPGADSKMDIDSEPAAREDGYDDQIADLERKLEEARQRKAARKEKKAARKGGGGGGDDKQHEAHKTTPPPPDVPEEPKADEKKKKDTATSSPSAKTFSFSAPKSASEGIRPRAKGDFSSTMARLRAAQAEKEARKKAEEEAAAAAAATTTTTTDGSGS
ncbi:hypothetical protein AAE478_003923 [Parahypoxylon ruwenzoriense]